MADRTRNFVSILYPESAAEQWLEILKEEHVDFFVSPLHSDDLDANGNEKKAHYHVMLMFSGPKTIEQAQELFDRIGAIQCKKINSLRGQARYLCHLDDYDKVQYSIDDVYQYGTTDYLEVIALPSDKYEVIGEMLDYCDREGIISYAQLLRYSRSNNERWFRCLCDSGTLVMREFIKSRTWELSASADNID